MNDDRATKKKNISQDVGNTEEQRFPSESNDTTSHVTIYLFFALFLPDCLLLADTASGDLEKLRTVAQPLAYEFLSGSRIDCRVLSCRIMLLRNNTLKIVNSSRADEGNYVCRAENQLGSAEMTASLWVKGKPCP